MRSDSRSDRIRARVSGPLPQAFDRWTVQLSPAESRRTGPQEWSGALIVVDAGAVEVECAYGARTTFVTGDVLALGCLPVRWLRNPGTGPARIVAIRRRRVASVE